MKKLILCCGLALLVSGCMHGKHRKPDVPPPTGSTEDVLAAHVKAEASAADHADNDKQLVHLAMQASSDSDACLKIAPHSAACLYSSAIALGLQAKAYPMHVDTGMLNDILTALNSAESTDPKYDHGGPARVAALLYLRAPGWPLGPGDEKTGLRAAQRAFAVEPDYPPNRLTLAEAMVKTGDYRGARDNYLKARELAQAMPAGQDRDDWIRQATEALEGRGG